MDKVQKIREEIEKKLEIMQYQVHRKDAYKELKDVLAYIDSLQEEPVSDRLAFKAIPRLLEMIEPTDRAKSYTAKLADALEVEGYSTDAKIVRESLKIMNGEKVPMATMDEEPVNEELEEAAKHYLYSNILYDDVYVGNLTDKDCIEMSKFGAKWQKEQFEKNRLAACKKQTKEEAEIEADFFMGIIENEHRQPTFDDAIKYGMKKMKEQMMAKAIDGEVGYWNLRGLSVNVKLPYSVEDGDKVKVILIKED